MTAPDSVPGTPEYMAPEQALGRSADHRSDNYALGIIVYQMVLGQTPFRGDTPTTTLMAHIHQAVPRPSVLDPETDPRLEPILLKPESTEGGRRVSVLRRQEGAPVLLG